MLFCVCYNLYIKRKDAHMMKNQKKRSEKAPIQKFNLITGASEFLLSVLCTVGFSALGAYLQKDIPGNILWIFTTISYALPIGLFAFAVILSILKLNAYRKKFKFESVAKATDFLLSHRRRAEQTANEKLKILMKLRRRSDTIAILCAAAGIVTAVSIGVSSESGNAFFALVLFLCSFSRLRIAPPKAVFTNGMYVATITEYPRLHSLAQKALDTLGCKNKLVIMLNTDFGASVLARSKTLFLCIGAELIEMSSEGELYAIFLHEFGHIAADGRAALKVSGYSRWLETEKCHHFLSFLADLPFVHLDMVFENEYRLYHYAASVISEETADKAMATYGNVRDAASVLTKLSYKNLYDYERYYDDSSLFESEQLSETLISDNADKFEKAIEARSEFWNKLLENEIISNNATHPTLRMRLSSIGAERPFALPVPQDDSFSAERKKAIDAANALIYSHLSGIYQEKRDIHLGLKAETDAWEASGEPISAETFVDIVDKYMYCGQTEKAVSVCERVINELPEPATAYAYFIKGICMLHRFDSGGIELVYRAIAINTNYIDTGLSEIGAFCCITGNSDELKKYRNSCTEMYQAQADKYDEAGILRPGDKLSAEELPDGMLDNILSYIKSIDEGLIEKVYLVKKIITDDFSTSVVIIRFAPETDEEKRAEIYKKIFVYLDTSSNHQFSLFDYAGVSSVKFEKIAGSCVFDIKKAE